MAQHLTGWSQESAVSVPLHRVFRILNETRRETVENPVEKVIRSARIVGLANHTALIALDGREIAIDDSAAPIRNSKGDLIGTVLVFRDITARRIAERELQEGRRELEDSYTALQKLNADLELFSYAAGHDIREPLRTIAIFSEMLARKLQDRPDLLQHIGFVQQGVARMRAMVDSLSDYSRLLQDGSVQKTQIALEEAMGETLLNCQATIGDSNAIIENGTLPFVVANRQQMVQLFQNLISNALKYRSEKRPEIRVSSTKSNGDGWIISVKDDGIGMNMEDATTIFGAFRRLHSKDRYPGTGLGLAMCKRIVELHGGRIWIESEPGYGSTFYFSIAG